MVAQPGKQFAQVRFGGHERVLAHLARPVVPGHGAQQQEPRATRLGEGLRVRYRLLGQLRAIERDDDRALHGLLLPGTI